MIFKVFKEKSIQKYINNRLVVQRTAVSSKKIKTAAVLFNVDEFDDFEKFKTLFKDWGLQSKDYEMVGFTQSKKLAEDKKGFFVTPKHFGWNGKIKGQELQTFLGKKYDIFISYSNNNSLYINQITAISNANLKVGLNGEDSRFYNLSISIITSDFEVFKNELNKYLKILNKI